MIQLGHVVRLVEQHGGLAPGALLVAPVGEFGRHDRINVGANPRIAQHLHRIAGCLQHFLEVLRTHDYQTSSKETFLIGVRISRARPVRR